MWRVVLALALSSVLVQCRVSGGKHRHMAVIEQKDSRLAMPGSVALAEGQLQHAKPNATLQDAVENLKLNAGKLPEQGFEGKDVNHKDMQTVTSDWRMEYGPKGPQNPEKSGKSSKSFGNRRASFIGPIASSVAAAALVCWW
mmetsp:Transcript_49509/g.107806  ORF Transcript_49509/g.107806 Transcript_49509/m.107806 type:complete len:142 (+) Transcript_49509:57-482(+)